MLAVAIAEGLAILLLGVLVVGLLRSHAEILRSLDELGAGRDDGRDFAPTPVTGAEPTSAHDVEGELLDGSVAAVGVVGAEHDTLLAFLSSSCATCAPFWSALADPLLDVPTGVRLVVVVEDLDDPTDLAATLPADRLVVRSSAAWADYAVPGAPHFVHVDGRAGRVVGEGTGSSWQQIRSLLMQATRGRALAPTRLAGDYDSTEDNPTRVDRELLVAGIGPGHPSLFTPLDDTTSP
jgi:hypothetical protein